MKFREKIGPLLHLNATRPLLANVFFFFQKCWRLDEAPILFSYNLSTPKFSATLECFFFSYNTSPNITQEIHADVCFMTPVKESHVRRKLNSTLLQKMRQHICRMLTAAAFLHIVKKRRIKQRLGRIYFSCYQLIRLWSAN